MWIFLYDKHSWFDFYNQLAYILLDSSIETNTNPYKNVSRPYTGDINIDKLLPP